MALQSFPGAQFAFLGIGSQAPKGNTISTANTTTMDAANEAAIMIGHMATSDGGSHTIDTTGSSSLHWRSGAVTFSSGSTIVKVGLSTPLATAGPPARATHASDVITFDVNSSHTGGGGTITANAWLSATPSSGTKTVANGDLVAFAIQMTARGASDSVVATGRSTSDVGHRPVMTGFTGGSYSVPNGFISCMVTFSDGAFGWIVGNEVYSNLTSRTWNNTGGTKEYGQLYSFPFPYKVYGLYGWLDPDADCDMVLYSDPLSGSPVAEKTVSIDANIVRDAAARCIFASFASPYSVKANQPIVAGFKPGASNVTVPYKVFSAATHRVTEPFGTSGYGVSRGTGAFSDVNSSLDHYFIGLIVGAFEQPARSSFHLGL